MDIEINFVVDQAYLTLKVQPLFTTLSTAGHTHSQRMRVERRL